MSIYTTPLTQHAAWKAHKEHYQEIRDQRLRRLFADDPKRGERFALESVGIYLDYSKNRVTDETIRLLLELAESSGLHERIDSMFKGEKINVTEKRAVLHVALLLHEISQFSLMGRMSCQRSRRCRIKWQTSPTASAAAHAHYHQYRHWWLRPRTIHGLRCLEVLE